MTTLYKMPALAFEKLAILLASMRNAMVVYEKLAFRLKDRQFHQTVIGLAQESRQYANELDSYVQTLGRDPENPITEPAGPVTVWEAAKVTDEPEGEREILSWCARSEIRMVKAYRELLNEPQLYEDIRRMVRYQLNGLLHSFAKLKLLNASLGKI